METPTKGQQPNVADRHSIMIFVNGEQVELDRKTATGLEIKRAAIEQGVPIEIAFALYEELPEGKFRVIGDLDEVHLRESLRFVADPASREITVSVNEQPVQLRGKMATGAQIKAAAIKQGVHIQQNFVLHEELPNGTSKVIGDTDEVHLREHLHFTAIAPDDNS
jgi:hypothetical protein